MTVVSLPSRDISSAIDQVAALYYRLVIVAGPSGVGKTRSLRAAAQHAAYAYINMNLELSRRMLGLAAQNRAVYALQLLRDIVGEADAQVVLLDNIELLFDKSLKLEPLHCLQHLSRNRTIVAAWNGTLGNGYLVYAVPGHPEYRRYPAGDLVVVTPGAAI